MEDYLEKLFSDAFKREFDQEENVVRSLPFFAAALGLAVAVFQQVLIRFPAFRLRLFEVLAYIFLGVEAVIFFGILYFLFEAVRASAYLYPPAEPEMLEWSIELVDSETANGRTQDEAEAAAMATIRRFYIEALADAAHHNRAQNLRKAMARTRGLTALVALLGLAFILAAAIFIERQAVGHAREHGHGEHISRPGEREDQQYRSKGGAGFGEEQPTEAAVDHSRGEVSRLQSAGRGLRPEGTRQVSDSEKQAPTPAAPVTKPAPPKMQLVQKIEHGSVTLDHNGKIVPGPAQGHQAAKKSD